MRMFLSFLAFVSALTFSAAGEGLHGIALYGPQDLRYSPDEPYRYSNPQAPKGGMLRLSSFGQPFSKLNPFTLKGSAAPLVESLVFETLMDRSYDEDEPFSQYGLIAERVNLADDKRSITYSLNKKARFSDGEPLTADDVVFSWNLIFDPAMPPFYRQYYANVEKCEKRDAHTVTFHFKEFNQELPLIMGQLHILPRHVYGEPGKVFGTDFDDTIPIGSGPYTLKRFKMGEEVTMQRDPDYWGRDLTVNRGRYNFDIIYHRTYLDEIGNKNAIKAGNTDVFFVGRARDWVTEYTPQKVESIRLNHLKKWSYRDNNVAGLWGFPFNLRRPMFQDIRVRKALASVLDFESLNENAFYGQYDRTICYFDVNKELMSRGPAEGEVRDILLGLHKKYNTEDAIHVPKDAILRGPYVSGVDMKGNLLPIEDRLKGAEKYLDQIGWVYDPEKNTRVKNGVEMRIELLLPRKSLDYVVNPFLENLRKIGIAADYRVVQIAEYRKRIEAFDFDMLWRGWPQSLSPGNEQRNMWTSASAGDKGSRNLCGIQNPAVDEAVEALISARQRDDLVKWVKVLDRILSANHYAVPGWNTSNNRVLYWQRFGHPGLTPGRAFFTDVVINWWWYDEAKARRLDAAIAANERLADGD